MRLPSRTKAPHDSPSGFRRSALGRVVTGVAVALLERARVAPAGSTAVARLLNRAADALVAGGKSDIFTPMYFFHARKRGAGPSRRS